MREDDAVTARSTNHSPDVETALGLLERADFERWSAWTSGLFHPRPFIEIAAADRLEQVSAWLAGRALRPRSSIEAAVANFARVLTDLTLVLHHLMEVRGDQYWVEDWYRAWRGHAGSAEQVALYTAHVRLIYNLGAELTRAVNLIVTRVQDAGGPDRPLAAIAAGPPHSLYVPAEYTPDEREQLQPYPGLEGFADALRHRDGVFGVGAHDGPSFEELDGWISVLREQHGPGSPPPLPPNDLQSIPAALARDPFGGRSADERLPQRLRAMLGSLTVAGVIIQVVTAPAPWAGAAVGATLVIVVLYRFLWRWPPRPWGVAVVGLAAISGALVASYMNEFRRPPHRSRPPLTHSRVTPRYEGDPSKVTLDMDEALRVVTLRGHAVNERFRSTARVSEDSVVQVSTIVQNPARLSSRRVARGLVLRFEVTQRFESEVTVGAEVHAENLGRSTGYKVFDSGRLTALNGRPIRIEHIRDFTLAHSTGRRRDGRYTFGPSASLPSDRVSTTGAPGTTTILVRPSADGTLGPGLKDPLRVVFLMDVTTG